MLAISNQIPFLTSIINTRERQISMAKSRVRTVSTGSLNQEPKPKPQTLQETKLPAPQKAQEVSKQSVRKETPTVTAAEVTDASGAHAHGSAHAARPAPPVRDDVSSGCAIM